MIKIKKRKFLLLPGDGIGPEVVGEVKKIIFFTSSTTSGPIPSPGNSKNFLFFILIIKYPWL